MYTYLYRMVEETNGSILEAFDEPDRVSQYLQTQYHTVQGQYGLLCVVFLYPAHECTLSEGNILQLKITQSTHTHTHTRT